MTTTGLEYDVVIPTHARSLALLDDTVGSVYGQTIPPARVIIVVDGRSDAVPDVQASWPDATVIDLPGPSGIAAARDAGIRAAESEWVCFVDDDDLWLSDKMQVTARYLSDHSECDAVRATYLIFADAAYPGDTFNGQTIDLRVSDPDELLQSAVGVRTANDFSYLDIQGRSLELLLDRNRSVIGTTCVRREVLQAIPPVPTGIRPGEDHLLACLVATRAEWHLIAEPLMLYRLHSGQDSRNPDPDGVLGIIDARIAAWRLCGSFTSKPLADYGPAYRREFRSLIWPILRRGHVAKALHAVGATFRLLPRWRDRLLLLVPEPIAWRWRHRRRRATPDPAMEESS